MRKNSFGKFLEDNYAFCREVRTEIEQLNLHLATHIEHIRVSSFVQQYLIDYLKRFGCVEFNTSIVTHGMQEYNQPIARILVPHAPTAYLRHSPQFEKQFIVLSTGFPYMQKAPCVRPGEVGRFHVPYLHQLDMEFPYILSQTSLEDAHQTTKERIERAIVATLTEFGFKVIVHRITYDEAVSKFDTASPWLATDGDLHLAVVDKPPLFIQRRGRWDTTILPMAMPIWESNEQQEAFISGKLTPRNLTQIRVYGYDFIISGPDYWQEKLPKGQQAQVREGIEVAGGSVRIIDPRVEFAVLWWVRKRYLKSFLPLLFLLNQFKDSGKFSAGGAIGIERLSMIAACAQCVSDVVPIPWTTEETPRFIYKLGVDMQIKKQQSKKTNRLPLRIIICGGGNDIQRILQNIANTGVLSQKTIAYVAIAAETKPAFLKKIKTGFEKLRMLFRQLGAKETALITSENFDQLYKCDIVVFSGGDTEYLLKILREKDFSRNIQQGHTSVLVGISAGAIAFFEQGLGTLNRRDYLYQGLGFLRGMVVPHSNKKRRSAYPTAIHLREYELKSFSL